MFTAESFENICYEAYKLQWMLSHNISLSELYDTVISMAAGIVESDIMVAPINGDEMHDLADDVKDQFLQDVKFPGGVLWSSKEEFLENEFRQPNYMYRLFELMENPSSLRAFYDENYTLQETTEGLNHYWVTMKIEGRFISDVWAENPDKACVKAEELHMDADYGSLEDIEAECIIVENEHGDFVWEK